MTKKTLREASDLNVLSRSGRPGNTGKIYFIKLITLYKKI